MPTAAGPTIWATKSADTARALELLDWWERELELCYAGSRRIPYFVALGAHDVREFDIPIQPFRDLLRAFRQDQTMHRYASWDDVLEYCRYSANPVGRLVLYFCGYRDAERQRLSDATCTALQLANFWQDVSRDLEKGRIYIPGDAARAARPLRRRHYRAKASSANYRALMKDLLARTRALFAQGAPLADQVDAELRVDLRLFSAGGVAILDAIEASGYNTLQHRPSIGTADARAPAWAARCSRAPLRPAAGERAGAANPAAPREFRGLRSRG